MKERENRQEKYNLTMSLNQLNEIEMKLSDIFTHLLIEPLKNIQT